MRKNQKYTGEFKEKVVKEYFSGKYGGPVKLARRHDIKSATQVKVWIKSYRENPENLYKDKRGTTQGVGRAKSVKQGQPSLEEQLEHLKMENTILKKLAQLVKENP